MPKRTGDFESWRIEKLSDPVNAANYLNATLSETPELLLDAIKDVIKARGSVAGVARQAGVTRESLYRTFSGNGNPTLETLKTVLRALDLEIAGFCTRGGSKHPPISEPSTTASHRRGRKRRRPSGVSAAQLALPFGSAAPLLPTQTLPPSVTPVWQSSAGTREVAEPNVAHIRVLPGFWNYVQQTGGARSTFVQ
jgi:probable addiction module antidote protein